VKKPVKEGGRYNGIAEHLAPFGEAAIGREDYGAFFISLIDKLEEEVGLTWSDGQVADLGYDEVSYQAVAVKGPSRCKN